MHFKSKLLDISKACPLLCFLREYIYIPTCSWVGGTPASLNNLSPEDPAQGLNCHKLLGISEVLPISKYS